MAKASKSRSKDGRITIVSIGNKAAAFYYHETDTVSIHEDITKQFNLDPSTLKSIVDRVIEAQAEGEQATFGADLKL
jgi:hypothetical protein